MNKEMKKKLFGYEFELQRCLPTNMEESKIVREKVMELLNVLVQQKNHEQLYPIVVDMFTRLAMGDVLSPLTDDSEEWATTEKNIHYNIRYPFVIKSDDKYFDTRAIMYENKEGYKYTNEYSKKEVKMPYMPVVEIVKDYETGE